MTSLRRNLAKASMEATRLHKRLDTPLSQPVDVFLLAQRLGLWLAAQPLDSYGFYLRQGDIAGIVVNSRHPESLQRYTCAHEIGHHVLGHESHADDAASLNRYSELAQQELQAQVFAASLLMPLPLAHRVLREAGTPLASIGPADVYLFSRNIGVSYAAAAWQLAQYNLLPRSRAEKFVKQGAAAAKDELRGTTWIEDARADVWVLDDHWNGIAITCRVGDEVHVRLPEDLSTGHAWTLEGPMPDLDPDTMPKKSVLSWDGTDGIRVTWNDQHGSTVRGAETGMDVVRDSHVGGIELSHSDTADSLLQDESTLFQPRVQTYEVDEGDWPVIPASGQRSTVLVPRSAGTFRVAMSLRPAWNRAGPAADFFAFTVSARERNRLNGAGFANPQKDIRVEGLTAA
jgi:Zn-dependent peptidase ImmA (M78 family)